MYIYIFSYLKGCQIEKGNSSSAHKSKFITKKETYKVSTLGSAKIISSQVKLLTIEI